MDAKIDDLGRRARRTLGFGLTVILAGCPGPRERVDPGPETTARPAAPSTPQAAPAAAEQEVPAAATGPCSVSGAVPLARLATIPTVLGIAVSDDRGVVVLPTGDAVMQVLGVTEDGVAGATRTLDIPNAEGLRVVAAIGAHFVVVTDGPCADGRTRCLTASLLDAEGRAVGAPVIAEGHAPIARIRRHTTDDALLLAFSADDGPPWVDTYVRTSRGLEHTRHVLGRATRADKQDEVLAITGTQRAFAVLHRIGSAEDPDGALVIESATRAAPIEALEEAAMIERFAKDGEDFAIIASFEFDRPLALRVRPDGTLASPARRIERGVPLPPPFEDSRLAQLEDSGATLELVLRGSAGDALGRLPISTRVDGRTRAASVARTRHGFLVPYVVTGAGGQSLMVRSVRCREQG